MSIYSPLVYSEENFRNYTLGYIEYNESDEVLLLPRASSSIVSSKFDSDIPFYLFGGYYCTTYNSDNITLGENITAHSCSFYNDMWKSEYTIAPGTFGYSWSRIENYMGGIASLPSKRAFHSIVAINSESGYIALVGGSVLLTESTIIDSNTILPDDCYNVSNIHELSTRLRCHRVSDDMFYLYDIRNNLWINMTDLSISSGFVERSSPAVISRTNLMYVLGGMSKNGTMLNDFWLFDVNTLEWVVLTDFIGKPRWMAHGVVLPSYVGGSRMYFLGGCSNDTTIEFDTFPKCSGVSMNDIWYYDHMNDEWSEVMQIAELEEPSLHAVVSSSRRKLEYYLESDHLFQYSLSKSIWERVDITPITTITIVGNSTVFEYTPPISIFGHSSIYYSNNLIVVGGYEYLECCDIVSWNMNRIYNIQH